MLRHTLPTQHSISVLLASIPRVYDENQPLSRPLGPCTLLQRSLFSFQAVESSIKRQNIDTELENDKYIE